LGADGMTALRGRTLALADVQGSPRVFDSADELLFACATGARTTVIQTCQWLVDVHRILHSPEAPPAEELLARARQVHLLAPVRAALRYLAEIVVDDVLSRYVEDFDAEPLGRRDRISFRLAGFQGARLAGPAQVLATYLQSTAEEPAFRAAARLPRHLQERWGAQRLIEVPLLALRKTLRTRGPQPSPLDRNRSASS
jgi:hypothetical protein